ncbi:MAG: hypothetical protein GX660_15350 [Clostridiaceae bacterium]|nr:hypothetical protein [Clostridiaceae bacterium]
MIDLFKRFIKEEDGISTVEIVIIIAVLVAVAIIFRNQIIAFVTKLMNNIFGDSTGDLGSKPTVAPMPSVSPP